MSTIEQLARKTLKGDERSIAKLLTMVENDLPDTQKAIAMLYPHTGRANLIGVTGPPGVGKSTLIEKLVRKFRGKKETVGVVAVDPSSPFTGGAFLGDRVRMQSLTPDEGIFIRSMATRGGKGGVAKTTKDVVKVLDASGISFIIVETVGAGQSEVEIMKITDTVIVVLSPGTGDEIQAMKAGMMEIGNIFVVNKADLTNSNKTALDLSNILSMQQGKTGWKPPVIKTVATTGEGVDILMESIIKHIEYIRSSGEKEYRRRRVEEEVMSAIRDKSAEYFVSYLKANDKLEEVVESVLNRERDPYTAVDELLLKMVKKEKKQFDVGSKMRDKHGLEFGITQVYTGKGKGKTSSAFGLALRAIGRGLRVYMIQFIKGGFDYGELHVVRELPRFKLVTYGRGRFIEKGSPQEEDKKIAEEAFEHAKSVLESGSYDIVILDEINVAINLNLLPVEDVLNLISSKPQNVELVLTGRGAPKEIIEAADLVTEMKEIKHPYNKGVKARVGIEY